MKLFTLQECFEQAGSVFPFTVIFHISLIKNIENVKITFIDKQIIMDHNKYDLKWIPENCLNTADVIDVQKIYHTGFAAQRLYEYKSCKFDKDMLDLLSEGKEK